MNYTVRNRQRQAARDSRVVLGNLSRSVRGVVRTCLLIAAGCACGAIGLGQHALAADPEASGSAVYVRGTVSASAAMQKIQELMRSQGAKSIIVIFDRMAFCPPPGRTEFSTRYNYRQDLSAWLDALSTVASEDDHRIYVGCPDSKDLWRIQPAAGWSRGFLDDVDRAWWKDGAGGKLAPAHKWVARHVARVRRKDTRPREITLVYVAGDMLPERVVPVEGRPASERSWRKRLLPTGSYWNPKAVAKTLKSCSCRLIVIAPEARFGMEERLVSLPRIPWASRPQSAHPMSGHPLARAAGGIQPRTHAVPGELERQVRRKLSDRDLRDLGEEFPSRIRNGMGSGSGFSSRPVLVGAFQGTRRFCSMTPLWCEFFGPHVLSMTALPSAFGVWEFVRTCDLVRGTYILYPFPSSNWLDRCPLADSVPGGMAPDLRDERVLRRGFSSDALISVLARASAEVFADTPWADTLGGHRSLRSWSAVSPTAPARKVRGWNRMRVPFDSMPTIELDGLADLARRIRKQLLPRYEAALSMLNDALAATKLEESTQRSRANALLVRFWLEMSVFHLSGICQCVEEHGRRSDRGEAVSTKGGLRLAYIPAVRMSDCLEAYDGRELPLDSEKGYSRLTPGGGGETFQGNVLLIPEGDPNYRARRALDRVMAHMSDESIERCRRMIRAAEAVWRPYSKSPWGWMVYYSEAATFTLIPRQFGARGESAPAPAAPPGDPRVPESPQVPTTGSDPVPPPVSGK